MSKTMITLKDGVSFTKEELVKIISDGIFRTFGLKASKSCIKPKYCVLSSHYCDDGVVEYGYKCFFVLQCSDGRSISYCYNSLSYSVSFLD